MKVFNYLLLLIGIVSILGCEKNSELKVEVSTVVKANKLEIVSDGVDKITFTAFIKDKDVSSEVDFYVDGNKIDGNIFTTDKIKEFTVYAENGGTKSDNQITFKSVASISESFNHKIIVEDYTGTWCGWCPRFIDAIEKSEDNKNFIPIAIHNDEDMKYSKVNSLMTMYGVEGYPTAILNRVKGKDWDGGDPSIYINKYSSVAIGLQTSIIEGTATVDVKVNFREVLDNKLRLVVYVLENKIIADQANYLSGKAGFEANRFYNLPNPVKDFSHNHVLRFCATDLKGDLIPDENRNEMKEYVKQYIIDISKYKHGNCDIVAFVVTDDALGSVNAQKVKLGESIFY